MGDRIRDIVTPLLSIKEILDQLKISKGDY